MFLQHSTYTYVLFKKKNLSTLQTTSDTSRYKIKYRLQIKIYAGKQIILECEYLIISK